MNETLVRTFDVELAEGDGRTLEGRIVPYNTVATVADSSRDTPYREMFLPGAFNPQLSAANRVDVLLNFEHRQSIGDVIGHGTSLEDRSDGLYGSFRVLDQPDGDKALELIREGVLHGLSVEFQAKRSRTVDGVTQRVDARVRNVALTRSPAYSEAQVLAVRSGDDEEEPVVLPSLLPPNHEQLERFGVKRPAWFDRTFKPIGEAEDAKLD